MMTAQQHKNIDQTGEEIRARTNRSPSMDSVSRLNQQNGGFAQRRGSFTKDTSYYQQPGQVGGFRRNGYNHRGRNYQRNSHYHQNQQQLSEYGAPGGFPPKNAQNRSFQSYSKYQYVHPNAQRPIFNSANEFGSFSVRRQSASSPTSSPAKSTASSVVPPILVRRTDNIHEKMVYEAGNGGNEHESSKIHMYRAAGTAPTGSSPFKPHQTSSQTPLTPSADKRTDDEWAARFSHPPPGLAPNFRRGQGGPEIEQQPSEFLDNRLPPMTPSPTEKMAHFRATMKDAPVSARSVDCVDAKHLCWDERMASALNGTHPPSMPLSTGSIDSGFFGGSSSSTDGDSLKKEETTPTSSSSPLSMTDEEGARATSPGGGVFLNSGFAPRKPRTRVRRSNRKLKQRFGNNINTFFAFSSTPTTSSSSSCCLSVAGSSRSCSSTDSAANSTLLIDELVVRLYFYFKSLLCAVNRQKQICESIAVLVKDIDARWGNSGVRRKACDPKGCLAPVYASQRGAAADRNNKLVQPARFPLCWAVPQPAIFYQLMAIDVLEYIRFLERVSPQVKTQQHPPGPPIINEREAAASIDTLHKLQVQQMPQMQQQQQQQPRGNFVQFVNMPQGVWEQQQQANRGMKGQQTIQKLTTSSGGGGGEMSIEKLLAPVRDSSANSRCSSRAEIEATQKYVMDKLDDEVTAADLDKTPVSACSFTSSSKQEQRKKQQQNGWFGAK
ncbi:unnamed protein product [Caenorhabditis sp. 36 PRJEB53466]|nr:unnamed protein product [Caenorhabditis sp. 36 PRJEB53466]